MPRHTLSAGDFAHSRPAQPLFSDVAFRDGRSFKAVLKRHDFTQNRCHLSVLAVPGNKALKGHDHIPFTRSNPEKATTVVMFYAIKSIVSDTLRTRGVTLQKDPARDYGEREAPRSSKGTRAQASNAAVLDLGRPSSFAQEGLPFRGVLGREMESEAQGRDRAPSPFDVLGRAVKASASSPAASGNFALQVPYEALQRAAASQDPAFGNAQPFVASEAQLKLPFIGENAFAQVPLKSTSADEKAPLEQAFSRSEQAGKPFGRYVPFDLRNPESSPLDQASDEPGSAPQSATQARAIDHEALFTRENQASITAKDNAPDSSPALPIAGEAASDEATEFDRTTRHTHASEARAEEDELAKLQALSRRTQAELASLEYERTESRLLEERSREVLA